MYNTISRLVNDLLHKWKVLARGSRRFPGQKRGIPRARRVRRPAYPA